MNEELIEIATYSFMNEDQVLKLWKEEYAEEIANGEIEFNPEFHGATLVETTGSWNQLNVWHVTFCSVV